VPRAFVAALLTVTIAFQAVPKNLSAQASDSDARRTQFHLAVFGGGELLAVADVGAGATWLAGGGIQFIAPSNFGGRLLASGWIEGGFDTFTIDADLVWQWSRNESRAWYLAGGPSVILDLPRDGYDDADVYGGVHAALGLAGTPGGFGLAPELRIGLYSKSVIMIGARLYVNFGPL
jgi:hypothetical protein